MPAGPGRTLILASESPRRLALLASIGVQPDRVIAPRIDEMPRLGETPRVLAERLALDKSRLFMGSDFHVLAADTVVGLGRRPLPQPESEAVARKCLALLSGRRHRVFTAVVLRAPDGAVSRRVSETVVTFARLTKAQQDAYIASNEWRGRAGGYAIQGLAGSFVRFLSGSYSGVVGLPLYETAQLLRGQGWAIP